MLGLVWIDFHRTTAASSGPVCMWTLSSHQTVDILWRVDTLDDLDYVFSLTVRIGLFSSHESPLTGGGSASLNSCNAVFALLVSVKHFMSASLREFVGPNNPRRCPMRRTATLCVALTVLALSGAQAQAGFLFFGSSSSSSECCNSAPKCCNPAPKCCNPAPKSSGCGLFSMFRNLCGSRNTCETAPACAPAPKSCSGGHAPALSPSAGSKVEDAPAPPPYEDKAPAPPAAKKDKAPAPKAPAKKAAPAPPKKKAAPAKKKAPAPKA